MLILKSNDKSSLFGDPNVVVSTIESTMFLDVDSMYKFETCIFTQSDSEVVERYETEIEAIAGHQKYKKMYGCSGTRSLL